MKLHIFYFLYALCLLIPISLGFILVVPNHIFVAMMVGYFGSKIHREYQARKRGKELVKESLDVFTHELRIKINNHFRNN